MTTELLSPSDRLVTLPSGQPELTLGWEAAKWATKYLRQPNGPRAGERWKFVPSQLRFLLWWYAVDEQGRWLFNHGVRRLSKGAGKSPFAATLSLIEFCAPVRLKDFDPKRPGGCVGKPVDMPLVQIAATAESQTSNTMRMVRALCPKGSRVAIDHQIDVGKTQFYRQPEGTLEVITSSAAAAEGAEATHVTGDETEHWKSREGGDLASTLLDNVGKSGNRMLETCNSWVPGTESVAEASWDAWVAQEEGRLKGEQRTLYDARIAPPDADLGDPGELMRALEFVYDDCFWVPLYSIQQRILTMKVSEDDARRKYLNQPTARSDAWVTPQDWSTLTLKTAGVKAEPSEPVAFFFDGSLTDDSTVLQGIRLTDGHVFNLGSWEPSLTGKPVPVDEVDAAVDRAFNFYEDVWAFFSDVREWESFAKVTWPEKYGDRLRVWAQKDGERASPIAWDMRSKNATYTKEVELVEREILRGEFTHDGDSVVNRHVGNARRRENRYGVSIGKESPKSAKKIDGAVCVVGARMVRRLVLASKEWQKAQKRSRRAVFV